MKSPFSKILIIFLILAVLPICAHAAHDQIAARQQRIAQTYSAELDQLYQLAESYAKRISVDERLLWLEFFKQKRSLYKDTFQRSFKKFSILKRHERNLRGDMIENYSLRNFAMLLLDDKAYRMFEEIADSRIQSVRLRRKALEMLAVMDQLRARAEEIEAHRDAQLARLETSPAYTDLVIESPAPEKVRLPAPQLGLVSAISYDGDNSLCMVEGVDEFLAAGDIISTDQVRDVKIVDISQNAVEFQKNGRTWTQTLGETPNAIWTK